MLLALTLAAVPPADVGALDAAVLPDGNVLIAREDGLIRVVHPANGALVRQPGPPQGGVEQAVFAVHGARVEHVAVDPRGEYVAASSTDGRVALWGIAEEHRNGRVGYPGPASRPRAILHPAPEQWRSAAHVAWTYDGEYLLTWTAVRLYRDPPTTVQLWSRGGEPVWTGFHARWAVVSPTESRIAAVREDEVVLVEPKGRETAVKIEGVLDAVAFSPDGRRLAVGGHGPRLWILDVETQEVLLEKTVDIDPLKLKTRITSAHWSPNGKWVGIALGTGLHPAVIDAATGEVVWSGGHHGGRGAQEFDVAWTPDNRLVTGFGNTYCVEPESGTKVVLAIREHHAVVPVPGEAAVLLVAEDFVGWIDLATSKRAWWR